MPTKLKNFWDDAPSENPPLTDEMVAKAETILGVKLPQLFIDLLKTNALFHKNQEKNVSLSL